MISYYITTPIGLQQATKNEIKKLGLSPKVVKEGYVVVDAKLKDTVLFNMALRTASRVFIVLDRFRATTFDELYDNLAHTELDSFFGKKDRIVVNALSKASKLFHIKSLQSISKKAIVDNLSSYYKTSLEETGLTKNVEIRLDDDEVFVLLDTTGESLHKRGYRQSSVAAPLREHFAGGLLLMARYYGKGSFVDPLCGSGTFPIEAALIAINRAPGLNRNFDFEKFGIINNRDKKSITEFLISQEREPEFPIYASDYDINAINSTRENIARANLENLIEVRQLALKDIPSIDERANVVTNMPYAKRIFDQKKLSLLENQFNEKILSRKDLNVAILSANHRYPFPKDRKANKIYTLYNAKIKTFFYHFKEIRQEKENDK